MISLKNNKLRSLSYCVWKSYDLVEAQYFLELANGNVHEKIACFRTLNLLMFYTDQKYTVINEDLPLEMYISP